MTPARSDVAAPPAPPAPPGLADTTVLLPDPGALPAGAALAALAGAGFDVGPFQPVERTLLDTFDGRLHAAGLRMELRNGAPSGQELIVSGGGPVGARVAVTAPPAQAGDLPAGPLRSRLAPILDIRALRPMIAVTAQCALAVRRNDADKVVVSVAVHDGLAVATGEGLAAPWAAEVTALAGYPRPAADVVALLESLGLSRRDGDVLDWAAAEAGVDLRGFVDSPTVPLDPGEPAAAGFRRVLANLADTIDANWQGTVDDLDPEFLHDLRIAVRRTRSILSHAKKVLPADGRDHFRGEFRWLGDVTSPARDLDVYVIEWPTYVAPLDDAARHALGPVVDHIAGRLAAEHTVLAGHLGSPRYRGLLTAWRAWLEPPDAGRAQGKKPAPLLGPLVGARLVEAQAALLARGRGIDATTPAEELHELRKDAKRLRYLLECFGGLLPAAVRKPFVQRLKALQDNLGEHQDTEVHTAQLRAMSQELLGAPGVTADTMLAMGRLAEVFDRRRQAARDAFAERFASYDAKPTARAFAELLDAVQAR